MPQDFASFTVGLMTMVAAGLLYQLGHASRLRGEESPELEHWQRWRRRYRLWITLAVAAIGGCALAAGVFGPSKTWMVLWISTLPLLMLIMLVAVLDASQTRRFYRSRLPKIRGRFVGDDSRQPGRTDKRPRD